MRKLPLYLPRIPSRWEWLYTIAKLSVGISSHSLIISELLPSLKHSSFFSSSCYIVGTLNVIFALAKLTGDNTACRLTVSLETSTNKLGLDTY